MYNTPLGCEQREDITQNVCDCLDGVWVTMAATETGKEYQMKIIFRSK